MKEDCWVLEFTTLSNVNGFSEIVVAAVLGVFSPDILFPLPEEV